MHTASFKSFFRGFTTRTQRERDEAFLAQSTDLPDLEYRQQEQHRRHLDQRPLLSEAGRRSN